MPKTISPTEQAYTPSLREVVIDASRNKLGEVMGMEGPYYQLRPIGGGREWDVSPEHVEKADPMAVLSAKTDAANRRSRGELP
jgi:hypothetical protein